MRNISRQPVIVLLWVLYCLLSPSLTLSQILMSRGFSATPDPKVRDFQPLLTGEDFALGFRRVRETLLVLAIVHVADNATHTPVWTANPTRLAKWAPTTELSFNGTLTLTDFGTELWSTPPGGSAKGDMVVMQREANLQVVKGELDSGYIWQSYDHPTNTIIEGQNLTEATSLVSSMSTGDPSPGPYSMQLDRAGFGLYADFVGDGSRLQQYWRRKAMQEKAVVSPNGGPIYAQVSRNGFLGMYQAASSAPVDVLSFDSFQRQTGIIILRVEADGNLRAYYWNAGSWVQDFVAIKDGCELPSSCGPMAVCREGGKACTCFEDHLDAGIRGTPIAVGEGSPGTTGCRPAVPDVTGLSVKQGSSTCKLQERGVLKELRAKGVDIPFKEFMASETMASAESCESACARNCSCWAAVYNNASGACYRLDYPLQTVLRIPDGGRTAYVKTIRPAAEGVKRKGSGTAELVVVVLGCVVLACIVVGLGHIWWWSSKRRRLDDGRLLREGIHDNYSSGSGGSVELSKR